MQGTRVDVMREPHLFDPAQTLEVWMFDQVEDQLSRNRDETIYRIVQNLLLIHTKSCLGLEKYL